ncbi:unnamed protein product [Fraxinus pennsylvanica]|uniref:DM2 domain-containing protein n=1 Tax=Fraxinus pennsylvanica TaxID=56036 RepID=A0AAD2EFN9_9LAMI|nr:unnamed protein product [Fraxinus pennsylvanica]
MRLMGHLGKAKLRGLHFAPTGRKRRGGPGGLNKLCGVSPELQTIVGQPTLPRTEIVKQLWAYIRKNNLQDPNNKRKIICNEELRLVFETDCTDMFKMNKLLAKHIIPLEPTKQNVQNSKKPKVDVESGNQNDDPVPIVIISEALANFFGSDEREMSQAEVLRQIWEYIKVHQLEDPLNSMTIICDAKLQELLGCENTSALGIPEMLAHRHLFKKSRQMINIDCVMLSQMKETKPLRMMELEENAGDRVIENDGT